jgi:hypothetical protein
MAITKKPSTATVFINQAPDSTLKIPAPPMPTSLKEQQQISLKLSPELLAKVDAAAGELDISRAAFIKMTLANAVK